jgi:hypothetical protein
VKRGKSSPAEDSRADFLQPFGGWQRFQHLAARLIALGPADQFRA